MFDVGPDLDVTAFNARTREVSQATRPESATTQRIKAWQPSLRLLAPTYPERTRSDRHFHKRYRSSTLLYGQ